MKASNLKPSEPFKGHFKRHKRPQWILPCKKYLVSFPALQYWNWVSLGKFATEGQLQNFPIQGFSGLCETRDLESSQVPLNSQIMDEDLCPNGHGPHGGPRGYLVPSSSRWFRIVTHDSMFTFKAFNGISMHYRFTNFIKYWYEMMPPANSIFQLSSYCSPSHVISKLTVTWVFQYMMWT